MIFPSAAYVQWNKDASRQIVGRPAKPYPRARVTITIFGQTRRASDLTNKAESVMDLLVENRVLEDDDWNCVPEVHLLFGGVEPKNPRAEVFIEEVAPAKV